MAVVWYGVMEDIIVYEGIKMWLCGMVLLKILYMKEYKNAVVGYGE